MEGASISRDLLFPSHSLRLTVEYFVLLLLQGISFLKRTITRAVSPSRGTQTTVLPQSPRAKFDLWGQKLGVTKLEDWYAVDKAKLKSVGAPASLRNIKGGIRASLADAYPDHGWEPWRFLRPKWTVSTTREFLAHLAQKEFNIASLDGWYRIKASEVMEKGGSGLLQGHGGSLISALRKAYPEHEWQEWKFNQIPSHFWREEGNLRRLADSLGASLRFDALEDWYSVTPTQVTETKIDSTLQRFFGGSLLQFLAAAYPAHDWHMWRFQHFRAPISYWASMENQAAFFNWALAQLGRPNDLSAFYGVSGVQLRGMGGEFIHYRYNGSLLGALSAAFPTHNWERLKFVKAASFPIEDARQHENSSLELKQVLQSVSGMLSVSSPTQWSQNVTLADLHRVGLLRRVLLLGGLPNALSLAFPDMSWPNADRFRVNQELSKTELLALWVTARLQAAGKDSFAVLTNFIHPILKEEDLPRRKRKLLIGVFVPDLQLGVILGSSARFEKTIAFAQERGLSLIALEDISIESLEKVANFVDRCLAASTSSTSSP